MGSSILLAIIKVQYCQQHLKLKPCYFNKLGVVQYCHVVLNVVIDNSLSSRFVVQRLGLVYCPLRYLSLLFYFNKLGSSICFKAISKVYL